MNASQGERCLEQCEQIFCFRLRISNPNRTGIILSAYGTVLKANGENVKTEQELLRRAKQPGNAESLRTGRDENEAPAQSRLVNILLGDNSNRQGAALMGTNRTY